MEKKKAFAYGLFMWMFVIIIYFTFVHERLGGELASWKIVDSIIFGSGIVCFGVGIGIAKIQTGKVHIMEEKWIKRRFED